MLTGTGYIIASVLLGATASNIPAPGEENPISLTCLTHTLHYTTKLTLNTPWALQMFDATTKLPDGLLSGNLLQLGNFDECLAVRVTETPSNTTFQGGYFRAALNISLPEDTNNDLMSTLMLHLRPLVLPQVDLGPQMSPDVTALPMIEWSLCLPSSCSPEDVTSIVQLYGPALLETFLGIRVNLTAKVNPDNCYVDDEGDGINAGGWFTLGLQVVLVLLVLGSGFLDWAKEKKFLHVSNVPSMLMAFSGRATARHLFSTKPETGTLGCLHGMRVFSMLWVILGHRYGAEVVLPVSNIVNFPKILTQPLTLTVLNGLLAVDTFFFLSGLLMSFSFLKEVERTKNFEVFKFYAYRYLRLVFPVLNVMLLYATLLTQLGSGPMYRAVTKPLAEPCRYNWWTNLLYINNYIGRFDQCIGQTWYLSVDMQLAWLSPLVMLPLTFLPRAGLRLLGLLTALACALPFAITFFNNYAWSLDLLRAQPELFNKEIYVSTASRASPYLVGILVGYFFFKTRREKLVFSKLWVTAGWCFSTAVCLTVVYSLSINYQLDYDYNRVQAAFYAGFHRLGWALGLAWITVACVKGYGGVVDKILSWGPLQPLSRLTYCAYLTHFIPMYHLDLAFHRTPNHFGHAEAVFKFLGDLPFVFAMSCVLFFTVEAPAMAILRVVFSKGGSKKNAILPKDSQTLKEEEEQGRRDKLVNKPCQTANID